MLSKLFPIIISDRFDQGGDTFQPSDDRRRNQITRLLRDFDENSVTRLPLDEADDGLLVVGAEMVSPSQCPTCRRLSIYNARSEIGLRSTICPRMSRPPPYLLRRFF